MCLGALLHYLVHRPFNYAMVGFNRSDEAACFELLCKRAGTQVHYCAEPFSNDGRLSSTFLKLVKRTMAAEYLRELSAKVHAGQCRIAERGLKSAAVPAMAYAVFCWIRITDPRQLRTAKRKSLTHDWPKKRLRIWLFVGILDCNLVRFCEGEA